MTWLILFAPLFGSLFAGLFALGRKNIICAIVPIFMLTLALICAVFALFGVLESNSIAFSISEWIYAGRFGVDFGFVIDSVSIVMIFVVLIVSLCVHIYSIGYMAHDECFNKFFAFLSAFVFSMLVLVMSDNFLGLFIGWEGVGLCSWMLIGFWHNRKSASFAANEAFIMNRVADLGMLLGIFLVFYTFGSVKYEVVFSAIHTNLGAFSGVTLTFIGILLFIGAMGKSAQFPLHTWLADAMEGPTPVSALIHAATMVTAGVYLVIRANPIYDAIPHIGHFIAYLGAFVALFAASMALVNKDLKRIIAYSTLSQLGYMFVAGGLGYYAIALFHLTTHAFFKSLLFLGAGNVMHAMNDKLDITKMGALWKPLKWTAILMIIASVALAGIYPFAGFFSKDKILESAFIEGHFGIYIVLLVGAFMTAFYGFRLIMLVFFAPQKWALPTSSLGNHCADLEDFDTQQTTSLVSCQNPPKTTQAKPQILEADSGEFGDSRESKNQNNIESAIDSRESQISGTQDRQSIVDEKSGLCETSDEIGLDAHRGSEAKHLPDLSPQDEPTHHHNNAPHEASKVMLFAMLPLALLAIVAGFFEHSFMDFIARLISPKEAHLDSSTLAILVALALFVAISGIILAVAIFRKNRPPCENFIKTLLLNQYYIPKLYDIIFVRSYKALAQFLWKEIDLKIIDFMVDFIARSFFRSGESARKIQSGNLSHSLMLMFSGIFVALALLLAVF